MRFLGSNKRFALSSSTCVAPFKKYRVNCLVLGSNWFSALILEKIGFQLFIGYRLRHFSNPRLIIKCSEAPPGICFLNPAGRRKRPFGSNVASYSPIKPIIINDLYIEFLKEFPQNNTFSHFNNYFCEKIFIHVIKSQV